MTNSNGIGISASSYFGKFRVIFMRCLSRWTACVCTPFNFAARINPVYKTLSAVRNMLALDAGDRKPQHPTLPVLVQFKEPPALKTDQAVGYGRVAQPWASAGLNSRNSWASTKRRSKPGRAESQHPYPASDIFSKSI